MEIDGGDAWASSYAIFHPNTHFILIQTQNLKLRLLLILRLLATLRSFCNSWFNWVCGMSRKWMSKRSGERQIKRWRATDQAAECDGLLAAEQAALSWWSKSRRERDGNPWNKRQRVWQEIAKIIDAVQAVTGKVNRLSDRIGYKSYNHFWFPFFCTNRGMKLLFKLIFFCCKN